MPAPYISRPTGQARSISQKMRGSDMEKTKEGEREHTEPIHRNGIFSSLIQLVPECHPYRGRGLSWLPDSATLRDFASEPARSPASHSLRSAAQCLHSICRPGGSR